MSHRIHGLRRILVVALAMGTSCVWAAESAPSDDALPPNRQAIAEVRAGRLDTALASWWGFDPTDATQSLQAALNSKAKKVVVENLGSPWIVTTIELPSDKEIVFESAVVVEAKRGEFLGKGDCLFVARGRRRLTIRGENATFRMHKADYHALPYEPAEWRHALSIRGCRDVLIEGLTLSESGGDGIYLGVGADGATNRDITIREVVCDGNNRQGISVITAENLLIENCVFRNTQGTAPEAGIDFEPNRPEERLVNCLLRNCRSENNRGHAYHFYLGFMQRTSTPVSIRLENCTSSGCGRYSTYVGVANRNGLRTVRGLIEYVGCRFDADQGAGVYIRGNEADGCLVRFQGCEIIRRDDEETRLAPITIEAPPRLDLDAGNIVIADCLVRDSLTRRPLGLIASPMTRLRNISGSLTVETPGGKTVFSLDAEQLARWFPQQGIVDRIARFAFDTAAATPLVEDFTRSGDLAPFRLRRQAAMLVWGEAERSLEIVAKMEPVGRHTPTPGVMSITPPRGETRQLKPAIEGDQITYRFTPQATGTHRLQWQGDPFTTIRLTRCSAPIAFLGESLGLNLIHPIGRLHFAVPAGVERFAIQVAGAGTAETVKATLRDSSGRVVDEQDNIGPPRVFVLERSDADSTEIWSITFAAAAQGVLEDVSLRTLGVPPLFGTSPADVFTCPASK